MHCAAGNLGGAGLLLTCALVHLPIPAACPHRSVPRAAPLLVGGLLETWAVRDELTTQNLGAAPRFVMVTTAGVLEVEKMRPVDVLAQVGACMRVCMGVVGGWLGNCSGGA